MMTGQIRSKANSPDSFTLKALALDLIKISRIEVSEPRDGHDIPIEWPV
jgi:hypothetical protein